MPSFPGAPINGGQDGGRKRRGTRRHGMSVKALKRALKSKGLKTTGKKAALTKRAKKAHLLRGGAPCATGQVSTAENPCDTVTGGRGRGRHMRGGECLPGDVDCE